MSLHKTLRACGRALLSSTSTTEASSQFRTQSRLLSSAAAATEQALKTAPEEMPTLKQFLSLEEKKRMRRSLEPYNVPRFDSYLQSEHNMHSLQRQETTVLQVNIGLHCNQSCNHCHVESSPERFEMMDDKTVDRVLYLLENNDTVNSLDITGGAPELNRNFRYLVENARRMKPELTIIDRCNLTVLYEDGQQDLKEFLAEHRCKLICSLPCYSKKNVNRQRGKGVFDKSIQALIDLNSVGYGIPDSGLEVDLVYNPIGAFLPPERDGLELEYKRELKELFGIQFNYLHTFNNMPIKRFVDFLYRRGELGQYMSLLVNNFNIESVDGLMCLNTINVSWSGHVFDCDFNQMVEMPTLWNTRNTADASTGEMRANTASFDADLECKHTGPTVFDFDDLNEFLNTRISTDVHCYACTAGAGSKCGT